MSKKESLLKPSYRLRKEFMNLPAGTELTDDNTHVIVPTTAPVPNRRKPSFYTVRIPIPVANHLTDTFERIG